ncbi:MAG TPA: YIP1 family protein [Acholeplasma sp.]|nr:YIP1 family protein [Acholeplasma sp.]
MKKLLIVVILAFSFGLCDISFKAATLNQTSAPYETFTIGPNGKKIKTQTAYEPAGILNQGFNLNGPEDMFIKDDIIYIADTGSKRIVKMDLDGHYQVLITGLNEPTGIHVDENNDIYIADRGNKAVYKYSALGVLISTFERPTEPIFGENSPYVPTKIVTGPRGIMYIAGEGSTNGLIQLNYAGDFLGFYGTNDTNKSWYEKLASIFNLDLAKTIPVSPQNLAIDEKGSVFTVSTTKTDKLKKFNIASNVVLSLSNEYQPVSTVINDFNNIYSISAEGIITEYDSYGNMIFQFGGQDQGNRVLGLFVNPVDIALDSQNNIYILDSATGQIQMLQRAEFTTMVHQGLKDFNNGVYSIDLWEEVLRMNAMFALANSAIARAKFRNLDYDQALSYYRIASDRPGYSDSFWQIRYQWMQSYLGIVLILLISLFVLLKVFKFLDKKYLVYNPLRRLKNKLLEVKLLRELTLAFRMFRHPVDTFYEIKRNHKGSYLSASVLYGLFIILNILTAYLTAFIFNYTNIETYSILRQSAVIISVIILFVFSNYLISTLSSGEGFFKDIYITTAYSLTPYIILTLPVIILSHGLTLNEVFIYDALNSVKLIWSLALIIVMMKEVHNYSIKELVKNILLTLFTMVMIVVIVFLVYILANQLYEYVVGIIREVILRASS